MFTPSSKEVCKDLVGCSRDFYSDNVLPLSIFTNFLPTYKDYTKVGLIFYILGSLGLLLFYILSVVSAAAFTVAFTIAASCIVVVITILSGIYVLIKPLTSRIPWSKLKFKVKK